MIHLSIFIFIDKGQAVSLMCPLIAYVNTNIIKFRDVPAKCIIDFLIGLPWF